MIWKLRKVLTTRQAVALENVLDYILQHEQKDFEENPTEGHVYYQALMLREGTRFANQELKLALKVNGLPASLEGL